MPTRSSVRPRGTNQTTMRPGPLRLRGVGLWSFGIWALGFGLWRFGLFGFWNLSLGFWGLGFRALEL